MRLYFILLLLLTLSCKRTESYDNFEGIIIYLSDDQMLNKVPVDSGKFVKHYFKGDSVRIDSFTPIGKQVHIKYKNKQKAYLIFVHEGKKIALEQDLSLDTIKRDFIFKIEKGTKKIAGIESKYGKITGGHLDGSTEVFFSENYPSGLIDIYDQIIPGLPTSYQLIVQQIPVNYQLVKLEHKELNAELFSIPKDCIVMTIENFLELMLGENTINE